jgi:hypothetical protein
MGVTAIISALVAIAKASPAVAKILETAVDGYRAWKLEQNAKDQIEKDKRNAAAIDAAKRVLQPKGPDSGNAGG